MVRRPLPGPSQDHHRHRGLAAPALPRLAPAPQADGAQATPWRLMGEGRAMPVNGRALSRHFLVHAGPSETLGPGPAHRKSAQKAWPGGPRSQTVPGAGLHSPTTSLVHECQPSTLCPDAASGPRRRRTPLHTLWGERKMLVVTAGSVTHQSWVLLQIPAGHFLQDPWSIQALKAEPAGWGGVGWGLARKGGPGCASG